MYKDRITKWRLEKKNKQIDMLAILRKKTQRDAVGKQSSFRVRGRPVTIEEVLHYFKRKKSAGDEDAYNAPTPSDVSCRTPSPTPESRCSKNDILVTEMGSSPVTGPFAAERNHDPSTENLSWLDDSSALLCPSPGFISERERIFQKTLADMCSLISDNTNIPRLPSLAQSITVS